MGKGSSFKSMSQREKRMEQGKKIKDRKEKFATLLQPLGSRNSLYIKTIRHSESYECEEANLKSSNHLQVIEFTQCHSNEKVQKGNVP